MIDNWPNNQGFCIFLKGEQDMYFNLGKQQIHYMLGDSGRSFVVGFGNNPPKAKVQTVQNQVLM